jgi:hypothetical protein
MRGSSSGDLYGMKSTIFIVSVIFLVAVIFLVGKD